MANELSELRMFSPVFVLHLLLPCLILVRTFALYFGQRTVVLGINQWVKDVVTQMLSISTVAATHEADFSQTGWHWGING